MIKKTSGWFQPFKLGWHDWPGLTKSSSLRGSHTVEKISLKKSKTLLAFRDIDDQRIQQSDWRRAFLLITCEPEFSWTCNLYRKLQHHQYFYLKTISAKSNGTIKRKSFKAPFLSYFSSFLVFFAQRIFFSKNLSVIHNPTWALTLCWVSEKLTGQLE